MKTKVRGKIGLEEFPGAFGFFKGAASRDAVYGIVNEITALKLLAGIPGIPKVLKPALQFQGATGFVREFVEGKNALDMSAELSANSKLVMRFAYAVMDILDQIHRKRLIHGDISPLNIIVRNLDRMEVSVIDFEFAQGFGRNFIPPENIAFAIPQGDYKAAPFVDLYALVNSIGVILCASELQAEGIRAFKDELTPQFIIPFLTEDWRSFLRPLIENHRHPSLWSVSSLMEAFSGFTPD